MEKLWENNRVVPSHISTQSPYQSHYTESLQRNQQPPRHLPQRPQQPHPGSRSPQGKGQEEPSRAEEVSGGAPATSVGRVDVGRVEPEVREQVSAGDNDVDKAREQVDIVGDCEDFREGTDG